MTKALVVSSSISKVPLTFYGRSRTWFPVNNTTWGKLGFKKNDVNQHSLRRKFVKQCLQICIERAFGEYLLDTFYTWDGY